MSALFLILSIYILICLLLQGYENKPADVIKTPIEVPNKSIQFPNYLVEYTNSYLVKYNSIYIDSNKKLVSVTYDTDTSTFKKCVVSDNINPSPYLQYPLYEPIPALINHYFKKTIMPTNIKNKLTPKAANSLLLIICTCNQLSFSIKTLQSIKRVNDVFDLLIIDDFSTDGTAAFLIKKVWSLRMRN